MNDSTHWLAGFQISGSTPRVDGLVPVSGYDRSHRPPEEVALMEKAKAYGADAVFFQAPRDGYPAVAQALIYRANGPTDDTGFAKLHKRLWSWGGVPLVYRVTNGLVQLFRCAHGPDFEHQGEIVCRPFKMLELAAEVASDPWWNHEQLRTGTIWDDPEICKDLLSDRQIAQKTLIRAVRDLHEELNQRQILNKALRRKLLILSVLIAYLEARQVFEEGFFARFRRDATKFFNVLAHGPALVRLFDALEARFNGNVFVLRDEERQALINSNQLAHFARLVEGRQESGGQLTLWDRYSFADLPVELISHVYQLFVKDSAVAVYTPHFLVRLMLGEVLSWERLDRLVENDEVILDPACGSGVFLVEAYKRLVLHWRSRNGWKRPNQTDLKRLLRTRLRGVDVEPGAVELAAFSLCLALCDALEPEEIRTSVTLFPPLAENTIHTGCFFEACEQGKLKERVGVVVGNPPFASRLDTPGSLRACERYQAEHVALPDRQLAYLFLHESMRMLVPGGVLCMLQHYGFLYNQQSVDFRRAFIQRWDVREILDFISVRGLFQKGGADTKVVVVVAEAQPSPKERQILHATFRRSGRTDAEQGFDIDYYDLHWLPRPLVLANDGVWRCNLLGGGRVLGFVERFAKSETIRQYAKRQQWDYGEGFIAGTSGKLSPGPHITGQPLIEPRHLKGHTDLSSLKKVTSSRFKSAYTAKRFQSPMVLVHEHEDLASRHISHGYYTYGHKIVGFCAGNGNPGTTRTLAAWLDAYRRTLSALVCASGTTMFTQRASSVGLHSILDLPAPSCQLELSPHEQVLVDDIVDYYRELIRLGEDSAAIRRPGAPALGEFNAIYTERISGVYKKTKLRALDPQKWPGIVCQPYVFGKGTVDWSGAEGLRGKLDALLRENREGGLSVTRIARLYDGACIYLLKPDRLRYWLRSIALRDADETLADLAAQGF